MDRMSICGEKREKYNNKHGTPYDVLQSTTMGAVLRIMERCHRKKRNYILDQVELESLIKINFYFVRPISISMDTRRKWAHLKAFTDGLLCAFHRRRSMKSVKKRR